MSEADGRQVGILKFDQEFINIGASEFIQSPAERKCMTHRAAYPDCLPAEIAVNIAVVDYGYACVAHFCEQIIPSA